MSEIVNYRKMTVEDIDVVYEIEKLSFTLPWTKDAFYNEMNINEHAYYVIAETDEGIVGIVECGS